MPTIKIKDEPVFVCRDPDHAPHSQRVFSPGTWQHTCPSCAKVTTFRVEGASLRAERIPVQNTSCWDCGAEGHLYCGRALPVQKPPETLAEYKADLPYRDVIVGPPFGEHVVVKGLPRPTCNRTYVDFQGATRTCLPGGEGCALPLCPASTPPSGGW